MSPHTKAVINVVGPDRKGIVAKLTGALSDLGVNIEDIEQQVLHGQFIMGLLANLADVEMSLAELHDAVQQAVTAMDMSVSMVVPDQPGKTVAMAADDNAAAVEQIVEFQQTGRFFGRGKLAWLLASDPGLKKYAEAVGATFHCCEGESTDCQDRCDWINQTLSQCDGDVLVLADPTCPGDLSTLKARFGSVLAVRPGLNWAPQPDDQPEQIYQQGVRLAGCSAYLPLADQPDRGPIVHQETMLIDVGRESTERIAYRRGISTYLHHGW